MKPVVSTVPHEKSIDKTSTSIPSELSPDSLHPKSSATADELKAKLRAWHSRFKNEKSTCRDKTTSIQQQSRKINLPNKNVTPNFTVSSVASRDGTNETSLPEVSKHQGSKNLIGNTQQPLPETPRAKNLDNSKLNGTDYVINTANFTGPLSLSEILKRKKTMSSLKKKKNPQIFETNEKHRVHPSHSPSSLSEVTGLGKRQMTSKDGQYVVSQSEKALNKKDAAEIQSIVKLPVNVTRSQTTQNEWVVHKPFETSASSTSRSLRTLSSNKAHTETFLKTGDHVIQMNSSCHSVTTFKENLNQVEKTTTLNATKGTCSSSSKPRIVDNASVNELKQSITTPSFHSNTTLVDPLIAPFPSSSDQVPSHANSLEPVTLPEISPTKSLCSPQTSLPAITVPMVSFQTNMTPLPAFTSTIKKVNKHVTNNTTSPLIITTALHTSSVEPFPQRSTSSSLSDSQIVLETSSPLKSVQSVIQRFSLQSSIIPASTEQDMAPVSVLSETHQSFASEAMTAMFSQPSFQPSFKTQDRVTVNSTSLEKLNTVPLKNDTMNSDKINETQNNNTAQSQLIATGFLEGTLHQQKPKSCYQSTSITSAGEQKNLSSPPTTIAFSNTCLSDSRSSSTSCSPKLCSRTAHIQKNDLIEKKNIEQISKTTTIIMPDPIPTPLPFQEQNTSNIFSSSSSFSERVDSENTLERETTLPSGLSKTTDSESYLSYNTEPMTGNHYQPQDVPSTVETLHLSPNVSSFVHKETNLNKKIAVNLLDVTSLHPLVRTIITATGPKTSQHYTSVMESIAEQTNPEEFQYIQSTISQTQASPLKTTYTSTEQLPQAKKHIQLANSVINVLNSIILDCVSSSAGKS